jgi:transcriptional regulator of met regulon
MVYTNVNIPHNTLVYTKLITVAQSMQVVISSQSAMLSVMQILALRHQTLPDLLCLTLLHTCHSGSNCTVTF